MTIENPTVDDMRIIATNIKSEGKKSRSEFLYNLSNDVEKILNDHAELIAAAQTAIDVLRRAAKDRAGIYEMLECADALAALLPEPDR